MMRNNLSPIDESLIYAASDGQLDQVKTILKDNSCNVNACDEFGATPMLKAAKRNDLTMMKTLFDAKASVNVEDILGQSSLAWANFHKNKEMIEFITSNMENKNNRSLDLK